MATRKEQLPQNFEWHDVQFALERIIDDIYRRLPTQGTPTGPSDNRGQVGDIWYDASFMYIKRPDGWYQATLTIMP